MNTGLVIIDMQRSLMDEGPWRPDELVKRIGGLVDAARAVGAPIFFVTDTRVAPDPSLVASLQRSDADVVVEKGNCDSFLDTTLEAELNAKAVDQLVVAGMQTDYCIDTTCRRAASLGYTVLLVGDAHSTCDHEHLTAKQIIAHHNHVLRQFTAGRGSVSVADSGDVRFA